MPADIPLTTATYDQTTKAQDDQERIERPVYYISRKLKDAETRYPRAERACLALIYATQRLCLQAHSV